jgi:hypothetical protein
MHTVTVTRAYVLKVFPHIKGQRPTPEQVVTIATNELDQIDSRNPIAAIEDEDMDVLQSKLDVIVQCLGILSLEFVVDVEPLEPNHWLIDQGDSLLSHAITNALDSEN